MSFKSVIVSLRPINLLMVYATQIIFYYLFFTPFSGTLEYKWNLYPPKIQIFALVTVLITASGYLINDYFDADSDRLNDKPKLSKHLNLQLYGLLVLIGFGLALWLAMRLGQPLLALIYLGAVVMLYLYSSTLKRRVLIGNIVVSLFTAGVPLMLLYAEMDHLNNGSATFKEDVVSWIFIFSIFSFLISMVREIVKDIEDVEGDAVAGYRTLPVVQGVGRAKVIAAFFTVILLFCLMLWQYYVIELEGMELVGIGVLLYVPLVFILVKLLGRDPSWTMLSKLCKGVMVVGLVLLIFYRLT